MSSPLEEVLTDLAVLGERLEHLVAPLDETGWRTPTPAPGWEVATQIAHLAWTDELVLRAAGALTGAGRAAWDALVHEAFAAPDTFVDTAALHGAAAPGDQILARWQASRRALPQALREAPAGARMPWFGPPMSAASMATGRYMETWAHSLDIHDALGAAPSVDDGVRHVARLGCVARGFAFTAHGRPAPSEPVLVRLTLPSGAAWAHGPQDAADTVTGPAQDFARLVTQRAHRRDLALVASGPVADAWLDVAQAFAGPPGAGREPAR